MQMLMIAIVNVFVYYKSDRGIAAFICSITATTADMEHL